METKHTKGKWEYNGSYTVNFTKNSNDRIGKKCTLFEYQYESIEELKANGKLIAAAPDLLEACQFAVVEIRSNYKRLGYSSSNVLMALESSIKKATE